MWHPKSAAVCVAVILCCSSSLPVAAQLALTSGDINRAEPAKGESARQLSAPLIARAQILLDRARFSPGEIDAKKGENFDKSIVAFAEASGLPPTKGLTPELWSKLASPDQAPAVVEYQISEEDVRGPFAPRLPKKLEDMKDLETLAYTSSAEALAEKFHMSEELLRALNPGKTFERAGETIFVANVAGGRPADKVARIEVDKAAQTLRAYDRSNKLLAFYPATIGSDEKPSPAGKLKVTLVQRNPTYHYNPEYKFKGVRTDKPFVIKSGPNNPVGAIWIGLSEKGYGIHGTPEPSKVSKAESHGCIRLTNWDAQDLGQRVAKGTPVTFREEGASRSPSEAQVKPTAKKRAKQGT